MLSGYLQERRFRHVIPYLQGSILDLGCGLANLTRYIQPGQRYVGIEGPASFLSWLNENRHGFPFYQRNLDKDLLSLDEKFDTIIMIAVIEHLEHPDFLVRQLPAVMNPGAKLIITTPSPLGDRIHRLGAQLGLFSKEAVEEHHIIFSTSSMQALLSANGLKLLNYQDFLLGGNQIFIAEAAG